MPRITQLDYALYLARRAARESNISQSASNIPERELHLQILEQCRRRGWIAIHARMDKPTTTALGTPDFVIIANRGRIILVEVKSKTGKLSVSQAAVRAVLIQLGHELHIVRSISEFYKVVSSQ